MIIIINIIIIIIEIICRVEVSQLQDAPRIVVVIKINPGPIGDIFMNNSEQVRQSYNGEDKMRITGCMYFKNSLIIHEPNSLSKQNIGKTSRA